MAANWKFIFSRRGIKLIDYVADCETIDDAILKFEKAGIGAPTHEELASVMGPKLSAQKKSPVKSVTPPSPKKKTTKKASTKSVDKKKADDRLVDSPRKVDDLVVL